MLVVRQAVVGPFAENTWVAACTRTKEALVIDPGGDLPRVQALVEQGGFRVQRIFLTHGHVDHVAGAAAARRAFGARLQIHALDRDWLAELPRQAEMFGFDEAGEVPEVDHWHADGEEFALGQLACHVIHTPGHSRGSCSLWIPAAQALFTGDTLFAGSVGRTDLPGGDFADLRASIVEKLFPLGDAVAFHSGHGPTGQIGVERRSNPFVGESLPRGRFL
ncbi:MAG: MBL fold metallo-hydrolase [Deltaproteobacteria bacterium]|nr:MBL fold metallo-hydrolase [Deltaproteobacteria bacterium]